MLLNNSPRGASLSVHYEISEFIALVTDFIESYLQKIDPNVTINFSQGDHDLYLYIDGLGWDDEVDYSIETINKLEQAGFGMDGGQNLETALKLMSAGRHIDYTLDNRTNEIILKFDGEGKEILDRVESIYESLDHINREEAAELIAVLYRQVKQLNWR